MSNKTRGILWVLGMCLVAACASEGEGQDEDSTPLTSGLYGPCGTAEHVCESGLLCLPTSATPVVFICTVGCEPSPKCPGVVAVGQCRAMLECKQGCCLINNLWSQSDTQLTCGGAEETAVMSDGYCQPWP